MEQERAQLQQQAESLAQRLEQVLSDKFVPTEAFDADTPIDKTLAFLQEIIKVSMLCTCIRKLKHIAIASFSPVAASSEGNRIDVQNNQSASCSCHLHCSVGPKLDSTIRTKTEGWQASDEAGMEGTDHHCICCTMVPMNLLQLCYLAITRCCVGINAFCTKNTGAVPGAEQVRHQFATAHRVRESAAEAHDHGLRGRPIYATASAGD